MLLGPGAVVGGAPDEELPLHAATLKSAVTAAAVASARGSLVGTEMSQARRRRYVD